MSCQQVSPRIAEDPYAFTETPSNSIFNPQINKLPSLQRTVAKFSLASGNNQSFENKTISVISKTKNIENKIINTQKVTQLKIIKGNQQQQQQTKKIFESKQQLATINGSKTVPTTTPATVIVNGNAKTLSNAVGVIKTTQDLQNTSQAPKIISNIKVISPSNSNLVSNPRKILPTMPPTQPQMVTLHQSHRLYSLTKQTPILAATPLPLKSPIPMLPSSKLSTKNTSATIIQSPPVHQQQSQQNKTISRLQTVPKLPTLPLQPHQQHLSQPLTFQQQFLLQQQQRLNINANNTVNTTGNINVVTNSNDKKNENHSNNIKISSASVQSSQSQPRINYQINSLPLPQSNFAQPQQIKLLSNGSPSPTVIFRNNKPQNFSVSPTTNSLKELSSGLILPTEINKDSKTQATSVIVENNKNSPPPLVMNSPKISQITSSFQLSTPVPQFKSEVIEEDEKIKFLANVTPVKRTSRFISTSSLTKLKPAKTTAKKVSRRASETQQYPVSINNQIRFGQRKLYTKWHAPDSYVFDCLGPFSMMSSEKSSKIYFEYSNKSSRGTDDLKPPRCIQMHNLKVEDIRNSIPSWQHGREKSIELRKAQLRRQALQLEFSRKYWTATTARRRLTLVGSILEKYDRDREKEQDAKICCLCKLPTLPLTTYCQRHICRDEEQKLFLPCVADQCKLPVFNLIHELPSCDQHAPATQNMLRNKTADHRPNTIITMVPGRKRTKSRTNSSSVGRPRTKKRKSVTACDSGLSLDDSGGDLMNKKSQKKSVIQSPEAVRQRNRNQNIIGLNSAEYNKDNKKLNVLSQQQNCTMRLHRTDLLQQLTVQNNTTQDLINTCDNSSAYESSEDTGVGGLSESELIVGANDVIEEIPLEDTRLLEEHDITNVLNQLPVDAFNDILFTNVQPNVHLENAPHDEKEDLERVLERAVVSSLQQMTCGDQLETNFLESFLDGNDEMLVDEDDDVINEEEICTTEVSSSNLIDSNTLLIDGCSNSNSNSNSNNIVCIESTPSTFLLAAADTRNLVQI